MFASQPFDSLLERVYITMLDLDSAVAEVERGLHVLNKGLDTIETDVYNGRLQLYGTGKVNATHGVVGSRSILVQWLSVIQYSTCQRVGFGVFPGIDSRPADDVSLTNRKH